MSRKNSKLSLSEPLVIPNTRGRSHILNSGIKSTLQPTTSIDKLKSQLFDIVKKMDKNAKNYNPISVVGRDHTYILGLQHNTMSKEIIYYSIHYISNKGKKLIAKRMIDEHEDAPSFGGKTHRKRKSNKKSRTRRSR